MKTLTKSFCSFSNEAMQFITCLAPQLDNIYTPLGIESVCRAEAMSEEGSVMEFRNKVNDVVHKWVNHISVAPFWCKKDEGFPYHPRCTNDWYIQKGELAQKIVRTEFGPDYAHIFIYELIIF